MVSDGLDDLSFYYFKVEDLRSQDRRDGATILYFPRTANLLLQRRVRHATDSSTGTDVGVVAKATTQVQPCDRPCSWLAVVCCAEAKQLYV